MFQFFKREKIKLFENLCDIHNHILPNIDDGSKNIEMSDKMLDKYFELGFSSVIPTPHVYQELYPNTPETIKNSFDKLLNNSKNKKNIEILQFGAEYMVDEIFNKNLKTSLPKLLIDKKYILIEINFFGTTKMLESSSFQLQQKNIKPILAHPERYFLIDNIKSYKDLKKKGLYFQLNALSLLGHYGNDVKKKSEKMLYEGLYDFVGTDAHSPHHLDLLKSLRLSKKQLKYWEGIREFQLDKFPF